MCMISCHCLPVSHQVMHLVERMGMVNETASGHVQGTLKLNDS